jgi:SPP1 gp7 family putative phage head morphogenesis protein
MGIRISAITDLQKILGAREAADVVRLAKSQDRLEAAWQRRYKEKFAEVAHEIVADARKTGRLDTSRIDFSDLVMEHSVAVMRSGVDSTEGRERVMNERLATAAPVAQSKSLRHIRELWDYWRKKKKLPPRQKWIARKVKAHFLEEIQKAWREASETFISGGEAGQAAATSHIMEKADVAYGRSVTIVNTETTHYYNKARTDIYDQSEDVTHYLFVAVRDHATTKWCKTRHGLVYKKGDAVTIKEKPPVHWNCRSEVLPLTPANPMHLKLIQDATRARRNRTCFPLPAGWNREAS